MTGLAGGGYPTGYRTKAAKMRSMSSRDTRTRLEMRMDERAFIGPRDFRRPPPVRIEDLRDAPPVASDNKGRRVPVFSGRYDPHVGTLESSGHWANRSLGPRTIDLTENEYREIKEAGSVGKWGRAFRNAYRIVRRVVRGKDLRLELALSLLDMVIDGFDPDKVAPGRMQYPGWTEVFCRDYLRPNEYGPVMGGIATGVTLPHVPCLELQSGIGGEFPTIEVRSGNLSFPTRTVFGINSWAKVNVGASHRYNRMWGYMLTVRGGHNQPMPEANRPYQPFSQVRSLPRTQTGGARPGSFPGRGLTAPRDPFEPLPTRMRDKKFIVSSNNALWFMRGINGLTEVLDFIDVAYGALGKKCKGAKTPQAKVACIYKNFGTMDWGKFLVGLAENQIEDYFWGRIGQATGRAARRVGRSTGFQTGPWDTEFSYHQRGLGFEVSFQ